MRLTLLFDLDGPILDVSRRYHQVYVDTVSQMGGEPVGLQEYWTAKRRKTSERLILGQSDLAQRESEYSKLRLERLEVAEYLALDRVQPGVLDKLRTVGTRTNLVLVTLRRSREMLTWQLKQLELERFFSVVLCGHDSALPGWTVKCNLVRAAQISPQKGDCFIGDTETDILAGRNFGMNTVAVCNGIRDESFLRALSPTWLLPSAANLDENDILNENPVC